MKPLGKMDIGTLNWTNNFIPLLKEMQQNGIEYPAWIFLMLSQEWLELGGSYVLTNKKSVNNSLSS